MTVPTMRERVARAWRACEDSFFFAGDFYFTRVFRRGVPEEEVFKGHPDLARKWVAEQCVIAVLNAMRDPTAIRFATVKHVIENSNVDPVDDVWGPMIDAVLAEKPDD